MYQNKFFLLSTSLIALANLSGCTEVGTLTKDFSTSVGQGVSTIVKDINTSINTPTSVKSQNQNAASIPPTDMVFLMGWMEDGCQGSIAPYNKISDRYYAFKDTVIDMDNSRAKPYSQWSPEYRDQIQNVIKSTDGSYVTFSLPLKNAYYRKQPLKAIEIGYREETEGAHAKLVFTQSANVTAVVSNFKTRKVEGMGGMYNSGATYNAEEKSLNCEL